MKFAFSPDSVRKLKGVHPDLVAVTHRALQLTDTDFAVFEGLRSISRQQELVASGASKTMRSRHITGHAVDLVPYVKGMGLRWDWPLCIRIAEAMRIAAKKLDVPVIWGGVWDASLNVLKDDLEDEMSDYAQRMRMAGKKPFLDGPHFELDRSIYPA